MVRQSIAILTIFLSNMTLSVPFSTSRVSAGFIENQGQVDSRVLYYASGPGAAIYLTEEAIVLDLREQIPDPGPDGGSPAEPEIRGFDRMQIQKGRKTTPRRGCAIWIHFDGANPSPHVEVRGELPEKNHFFLGNDPSKWRTNIATFREVIYRGVWTGVDLILRLEGGELFYEVMSAPGSDPSVVRFHYEGQDRVLDQPNSSIWVQTCVGWLSFLRSGLGQEMGKLLLMDSGDSNLLPSRQRDNPSTLLWSTFLGASNTEYSRALSIDNSGNTVVLGETFSSDFPTTPGAYDESYNAGPDVFVAKLDEGGGTLLWSTFVGGSGYEESYFLSLDTSGNPVITGRTDSSDFPITPGAYDESHNGWGDVFVAKLDAEGSTLLWSTFVGGSGYDWGCGLSLDLSGNSVVTGYTTSSDFPVTPGVYDESYNDLYDVFVAKLNAGGSTLLWSTFLGGSNEDKGRAVALDPSGNPVVAGNTLSSNFPTTSGAYDESHNGSDDVFIAKLDQSGSMLLWSTFLGGNSEDLGLALSLDSSGNPVVTGRTGSSNFPTTPGAYDESYNGYGDVFVVRLDASGSALIWSTFLGGSGSEYGHSLSLDPSGNPVVNGSTDSSDFPTTQRAFDQSFNGDDDAFVTKLDAGGMTLLWSTFLGGHNSDYCVAVRLDPSGNSVVTGYTISSDFPTTTGAYDESHNGAWDVFVAKLDLPGFPHFAIPRSTTIIEDPRESSGIPQTLDLEQNRPNPFNPTTIISLNIAGNVGVKQHVNLTIYDIRGRQVKTLIDSELEPGNHRVVWDGRDEKGEQASSGIYLYTLRSAESVYTRKMVMLK